LGPFVSNRENEALRILTAFYNNAVS